MLKELTKQYINAFDKKDLDSISNLLNDDFKLSDPAVKTNNKAESLKAIDAIFNSCENLNFSAKNIFVCENISIIEFILELDSTILEGADIIEWENGKLKELRAYLDMPKS